MKYRETAELRSTAIDMLDRANKGDIIMSLRTPSAALLGLIKIRVKHLQAEAAEIAEIEAMELDDYLFNDNFGAF